jgi:hypothetical protein
VFASGAFQQSRLGFSARTFVIQSVRAIVDRGEMRSRRRELPGHEFVDGVHHGFREKSASHAGLIGHHDDWQFRIVQLANGARGEGKHTKLAGIIQVADFFGDGAVAIEKDGGTPERGLRQSAPPRRRATIPRPWQHSRAKFESCSDDRWGSGAGNMGCSRVFLERWCSVE